MKSPTLTTQTRVKIADIEVGARLRPVSAAGVASLIASITETGVMKDAIHLRKRKDGRLVLIAGAHRLAAATELGWDEIEAKVWTDVTDDWSRLMEIDDNLAGAEMNALDTAVFLAQRKEVYERLHPEAKHGGDRRSANFQMDIMSVWSFAAATAEKFGLTDRHVRRMISVGGSLHSSEIDLLRKAERPVRLVDLQALAKVGDAVERQRIVELFAGGESKSVAAARGQYKADAAGVKPTVKDPVEQAFMALRSIWSRAPKAAKLRFVASQFEELGLLGAEEEERRFEAERPALLAEIAAQNVDAI